jgi:hypothetical protein
MSTEQRLAFFKEYLTVLITDPLNLPVWWMLQLKFMVPAMMISRNDEMEKWLSHFSLNGIRSSNLCKPYQT